MDQGVKTTFTVTLRFEMDLQGKLRPAHQERVTNTHRWHSPLNPMAAFSLEDSTWVTVQQGTLPQKSAVSCSWELPGQTALAQHLQWVFTNLLWDRPPDRREICIYRMFQYVCNICPQSAGPARWWGWGLASFSCPGFSVDPARGGVTTAVPPAAWNCCHSGQWWSPRTLPPEMEERS